MCVFGCFTVCFLVVVGGVFRIVLGVILEVFYALYGFELLVTVVSF